jgi:hypothetical protein
MDDLDRMLSDLSREEAPPGLAQRSIQNYRVRQRSRRRWQNLGSVALLAAGAWLVLPGLAALSGQVSLPSDGLGVLQSIVYVRDTSEALGTTLRSAQSVQQSVSASLAGTSGLGMILALGGALLGLDALLPRGFYNFEGNTREEREA